MDDNASRTLQQRRRVRNGLASAFGIIAVFGLLSSVLAVWAHRTLFDSRAVGRAVDQVLQEPEVVEDLSIYLTDQILESLEVARLVRDSLPPELRPTAPLLFEAIHTLVHDGITRALEAERARAVMVAAAEKGHEAVMRLLDRGEIAAGVTVESGTVSINLLPLMTGAIDLVGDQGLLGGADIPTFEMGGEAGEQIAVLEAILGRPLPDDFGQLVIYDSERVAEAEGLVARMQQALVLFRKATVAILATTVVSAVAAVAFAVRRRRALLLLSIGTLGAVALGRAIILELTDAVPALAVRPGAHSAIKTVISSLAGGLLTALTTSLLVAAVLTTVTFASNQRGEPRSSTVIGRYRLGAVLVVFTAATVVVAYEAFTVGALALIAVLGTMAAALACSPPRPGRTTSGAT